MPKTGNNGSKIRENLIKKCDVDFEDYLQIDKETIHFEDQISVGFLRQLTKLVSCKPKLQKEWKKYFEMNGTYTTTTTAGNCIKQGPMITQTQLREKTRREAIFRTTIVPFTFEQR